MALQNSTTNAVAGVADIASFSSETLAIEFILSRERRCSITPLAGGQRGNWGPATGSS